ncbi:hypothetical protein EV421DRAFT_1272151 [Armillaria borealis]|uniref:Uncharacterized protein n=1 Tax=Armillaria borealis TaxID=47425 RepID=A0AA39J3J9_9AGAR|nr:hypothetical protein EV421DRAFT_1272151 [Armillaria borealis]
MYSHSHLSLLDSSLTDRHRGTLNFKFLILCLLWLRSVFLSSKFFFVSPILLIIIASLSNVLLLPFDAHRFVDGHYPVVFNVL